VQGVIKERMACLCAGVGASYGADIALHYTHGYPPTINSDEACLEALYAAAHKGLKGDSLALAAGLLPAEYRRLASADPLVELAVAKGKADAERQLSDVLHTAALAGDTKVALEILKHKHDWVAKSHVQVEVAQQISITDALAQAQARVIDGEARVIHAG
jgi:hypothetical protein